MSNQLQRVENVHYHYNTTKMDTYYNCDAYNSWYDYYIILILRSRYNCTTKLLSVACRPGEEGQGLYPIPSSHTAPYLCLWYYHHSSFKCTITYKVITSLPHYRKVLGTPLVIMIYNI